MTRSSAYTHSHTHTHAAERRLIEALSRSGPQTIEALSLSSGLSWSQVFLAIDRLSRSGAIALRPSGAGEYHVSVTGTAV